MSDEDQIINNNTKTHHDNSIHEESGNNFTSPKTDNGKPAALCDININEMFDTNIPSTKPTTQGQTTISSSNYPKSVTPKHIQNGMLMGNVCCSLFTIELLPELQLTLNIILISFSMLS